MDIDAVDEAGDYITSQKAGRHAGERCTVEGFCNGPIEVTRPGETATDRKFLGYSTSESFMIIFGAIAKTKHVDSRPVIVPKVHALQIILPHVS